jgi:hypothetical protein
MCKRWPLLFIPFFLLPYLVSGQSIKRLLPVNSSFQLQGHYGFFITDAPKAMYLRDSYSSFMEVGIAFQADGSKSWHSEANFPSSGISFLYGNTGSKAFIGNVAAIYPYTRIPLLTRARFSSLFKTGAGLAWIEKPYDIQTNHKNTLIGSHWNAIIQLGLINEWRLTPQLFINAGLSFTHFSNGTSTLPNLGLNIPALTLGTRYAFQQEVRVQSGEEKTVFDKTLQKRVYTSFGMKQRPWIASKRHVIPNVQAEIVKPVTQTISWGGGLMLSYDPALQREIPDAIKDLFDESDTKIQAGLFAMYEYRSGRISFPLQAGVYLLNKYAVSSLFQNIGANYQINKHWAIRGQLKTHLGKADYIHIGGGYTF